MREKNSIFSLKLFIFLVNFYILQSIDIQFEIPNERDFNIRRLDPFEDFFTMDDNIEKIANALISN
jgi:hypothetical protein